MPEVTVACLEQLSSDLADVLRQLSSDLADVLRPYWRGVHETHVPVRVTWLLDANGEVVMNDEGIQKVRLADANSQVYALCTEAADALFGFYDAYLDALLFACEDEVHAAQEQEHEENEAEARQRYRNLTALHSTLRNTAQLG